MPELPEVETIACRLHEHIAGKTIARATVLRTQSFSGDPTIIVKSKVVAVKRRAKVLIFELSGKYNLLSHLKMTGQFIYVADGARVGGGHPTADWVQELPSKHTRVIFEFTDCSKLFFNDMRVFGWVRMVTDDEQRAQLSQYAPDIISPEITLDYYYKKLQKTTRAIKSVVMDNSIASGVGNIYACDGCNLAGIHPERPASSLSLEETRVLLAALRSVIHLGIKLGGATIDSFSDVAGFAGGYQNEVLVYGREGKPCKNCASLVQKTSIAGRGTYYCAGCQR